VADEEVLVGVRLVGVLVARRRRDTIISGWLARRGRIIFLVMYTLLFLWSRCICRRVGRRGVRTSNAHWGVRRWRSDDVGRRRGAKGMRRRARLLSKERGKRRVRATRKFDGSLVCQRLHKNSRGGGCVVVVLLDVTSTG
jgi:hypothetical protein